jgi:putative ATP-dependent endonuclease of the OLD family
VAVIATGHDTAMSSCVAASKPGRKTKLCVSQLTHEHLRKTMGFFLAMRKDQEESSHDLQSFLS